MKRCTIAEAQVALQAAADQVGAKNYEAAKALVLNDLLIVDEAGTPVDPANINYEVTLSAAEPVEAALEAPATESSEKSISSIVAKAVSSELAKVAPKATRPAPVVTAPKCHARLKAFTTPEQAYRFGSWAAAAMGHRKSAAYCADHGIVCKANNEGSGAAGGFLVPDEFANTLITLRESFGVARKHCRVFPMASDILTIPKRNSNLTAYFVGEAATGTQSDETFAAINLVAKKSMVLNKASSELNEDSLVSWADDLAAEMVYAQSSAEDGCLFLGDGTSTYGGMVGLANAVGSAGTSTATSTAFTAITIAQVNAAMALLPQYADNDNAKIFCSKAVWNNVFLRLAAVAGGNSQADLLGGDKQLKWAGYDVVLCQKMNATTGNGAIVFHFGDMSQAAYFGNRRDTSIEFSNSALNAFEQDQLVYRATTRFDIVCANVGDSSTAGSIVTLKAGA